MSDKSTGMLALLEVGMRKGRRVSRRPPAPGGGDGVVGVGGGGNSSPSSSSGSDVPRDNGNGQTTDSDDDNDGDQDDDDYYRAQEEDLAIRGNVGETMTVACKARGLPVSFRCDYPRRLVYCSCESE